MSDRHDRLHSLLTARFAPEFLRISDDSAQHAGHAGAAPGGQTHYTVDMVSQEFAGKSRVARQRAVNDAIAGEFASGLHALALRLRAPGEP
jgi:BolA family transcriptional regulator, general stress-responsive regulator